MEAVVEHLFDFMEKTNGEIIANYGNLVNRVLQFVQKFFNTIADYPFQSGSSLSAGNIGYHTIEIQKAKGGLKKLMDAGIRN